MKLPLSLTLPVVLSAELIHFDELPVGTALSNQYPAVTFNMSYGTAEAQPTGLGEPFVGNQLLGLPFPGEPNPYTFLTIRLNVITLAQTVSFDLAGLGSNPVLVVQVYGHQSNLLEEHILFERKQKITLSKGVVAFICVIDATKQGFAVDNFKFQPLTARFLR